MNNKFTSQDLAQIKDYWTVSTDEIEILAKNNDTEDTPGSLSLSSGIGPPALKITPTKASLSR